MCERCEERCARAGYESDYARTVFGGEPGPKRPSWDELEQWQRDCWLVTARAVREASRLSECPEAVEACARQLYADHGEGVRPPMELDIEGSFWRLRAKGTLRAAEDAVMGKGKK
jgi:hypothetical protein